MTRLCNQCNRYVNKTSGHAPFCQHYHSNEGLAFYDDIGQTVSDWEHIGPLADDPTPTLDDTPSPEISDDPPSFEFGGGGGMDGGGSSGDF